MSDPLEEVTPADVAGARARIAGRVRWTPTLRCPDLDRAADGTVVAKCEHLQRTGSFKLRGATNAVRRLVAERPDVTTVVTHSSGNHGAALATAAADTGLTAVVVVPRGAPAVKVAAVEAAGATVIRCGPDLADREAAVAELSGRPGHALVHPYDDPAVIAGQGTAAAELLEEHPGLEVVVVPVGGGGLLAGTATAAGDRCEVWGAEPAGADDAARSLAAGRLVSGGPARTVADGLRARLSERTLAVIAARAAGIVVVDDADTMAALRFCWRHTRQIIEPSAAVALAAVLSGRWAGRRVGVILTGGNVDLPEPPVVVADPPGT